MFDFMANDLEMFRKLNNATDRDPDDEDFTPIGQDYGTKKRKKNKEADFK